MQTIYKEKRQSSNFSFQILYNVQISLKVRRRKEDGNEKRKGIKEERHGMSQISLLEQ